MPHYPCLAPPSCPDDKHNPPLELLPLFGYALTQSVLTFDVEIALCHGILEF